MKEEVTFACLILLIVHALKPLFLSYQANTISKNDLDISTTMRII